MRIPILRPSRRSLRFSLRSLFIAVALIGCWMGYEVNWIRQRHSALRQEGIGVHNNDLTTGSPIVVQAPGLLWVFGERGYAIVSFTMPPGHDWDLTPAEQADFKRIARLYPEAEPTVIGPNQRPTPELKVRVLPEAGTIGI